MLIDTCAFCSDRRLFEYQKQERSLPSTSQPSGGVVQAPLTTKEAAVLPPEEGDEEENSPPIQVKDRDRVETFSARQKLSECRVVSHRHRQTGRSTQAATSWQSHLNESDNHTYTCMAPSRFPFKMLTILLISIEK